MPSRWGLARPRSASANYGPRGVDGPINGLLTPALWRQSP